jgi:hypothetical protein
MIVSKTVVSVAVLIGLVAGPTFAVNIETVRVGNPGNAADQTMGMASSPRWAVYQMGKYETNLNTSSSTIKAELPTPAGCTTKKCPAAFSGINVGQFGQPHGRRECYEKHAGDFLRWYDAIRFANWLQNGW